MSPPGYPSAWVASLQSPTSVSPGEVHCSSVAHDVGDLGWQSIVGGASLVAHLYSQLLIQWVLAVLALCELAWYALLSPDFLPSPLRVFGKVLVSLIKISINGVPLAASAPPRKAWPPDREQSATRLSPACPASLCRACPPFMASRRTFTQQSFLRNPWAAVPSLPPCGGP